MEYSECKVQMGSSKTASDKAVAINQNDGCLCDWKKIGFPRKTTPSINSIKCSIASMYPVAYICVWMNYSRSFAYLGQYPKVIPSWFLKIKNRLFTKQTIYGLRCGVLIDKILLSPTVKCCSLVSNRGRSEWENCLTPTFFPFCHLLFTKTKSSLKKDLEILPSC